MPRCTKQSLPHLRMFAPQYRALALNDKHKHPPQNPHKTHPKYVDLAQPANAPP
jgi:hypothetical protein